MAALHLPDPPPVQSVGPEAPYLRVVYRVVREGCGLAVDTLINRDDSPEGPLVAVRLAALTPAVLDALEADGAIIRLSASSSPPAQPPAPQAFGPPVSRGHLRLMR